MTSHRPGFSHDDKRLSDAARWYARHESDRDLSLAEWREWEEWSSNPGNSAEYDEFVRIHQQTRRIERPALPSDDEIRADTLYRTGVRRISLRLRAITYRLNGPFATGAVTALLLAVVLTGAVLTYRAYWPKHATVSAEVSSQDGAIPFTDANLGRLRASGRPVLVNLRAAWCGTCVVNERTLSSQSVQKMMVRKRVAYLKGDWTDQSPAISATIQQFGRYGVPLYLLYCPGSNDPTILPQVLTEDSVLSALARLPDRVEPNPSG
jgi:hypothetical protein